MKFLRVISIIYFWFFVTFSVWIATYEVILRGIQEPLFFVFRMSLTALCLIALFISAYNTKIFAGSFFKIIWFLWVILIVKNFIKSVAVNPLMDTLLVYSLIPFPSIIIVFNKFFREKT